jgi:hypothetical protein
MKKRNYLILPESVVLDIMYLVSRLGETAVDYHDRIGSTDTQSNIGVYTRIIEKLMDLEEADIDYKPKGITFEELLKQCGITKPNKEDE